MARQLDILDIRPDNMTEALTRLRKVSDPFVRPNISFFLGVERCRTRRLIRHVHILGTRPE